ncbi:superinfection immunity protein [Pseudomonas shirazensis]|uniref:superinfection immunity protein n=1 Tax=Pseudomonas shirazensis TaxID=2745494 RepID=UPI00192E01F5|nr:superinfection immunity protein [Pseudomonas shirazensis]MBV4500361.1 superinfection immunity protein [Pseudomonas shirazensis]
MFVVRLLVLGFLAFFSFAMGTERGGLNAFGTLMAFSGIIFVPAFYMLPTIEAGLRKSNNLGAIAALNFFLGWSLLGWVAALVWAFKNPSPVVITAHSPESAGTTIESSVDTGQKPKKDCPFCGEEVLAVAIKCKHCGSDLAAEGVA